MAAIRTAAIWSLGLACAAAPSLADWQQQSFDNGMWFEAWAYTPDRSVRLNCGGLSPTGLPPPATDEAYLTAPYTLHLGIGTALAGPPASYDDFSPLPGAMVVAGSNGYVLPGPEFDQLNSDAWIQPLGFGDPLVAALLDGADGRLELRMAGRAPLALDPAGLAPALATALAFCDARWAALGNPVPPQAAATIATLRAMPSTQQAPAQPPAQAASPLRAVADRHIFAGCRGVATADPDYLIETEIDGDGVPDVILDWGGITCPGAAPRPSCGAAYCSIDVFLSTRPGQTPSEGFLGIGVRVEPGLPGRADLVTHVTAGSCPQTTRPATCEQVWRWTGTSLEPLPTGAK